MAFRKVAGRPGHEGPRLVREARGAGAEAGGRALGGKTRSAEPEKRSLEASKVRARPGKQSLGAVMVAAGGAKPRRRAPKLAPHHPKDEQAPL